MTIGTRRTLLRLGAALLVIVVMAGLMPLARADLYGASKEYKEGDYAHAFSDFMELAELGQPQAQFNVAAMYESGQGVDQSGIHAYAWAELAAENHYPGAEKLADEIRPRLAPGSERIAGWFTAPYTPAALSLRLLPIHIPATRQAAAEYRTWIKECLPVAVADWVYPDKARQEGMEGDVFVAYTLMPDGRARVPRVILGVPPGVFGAATRESILNDRFAPLPPGSRPIQCVTFYRFTIAGGESAYEYPGLNAYVDKARKNAQAGDPSSQLLYGMLLVGLPQLNKTSSAGLKWFLRAAQAGLPLAQFEVGYSLLMGWACQRDEAKAIEWLHMAADQNEPNAEVTLAIGAMRRSPGFGDITEAEGWLEKAAAQGNHDGELYLSALLAATPEPGLRDPQRALELLKAVSYRSDDDPTAVEIRAAAQAADGDFTRAVASEKKAIRQARYLRWDLSPLERRLADYQAGKAWYGNLLAF
ncbi:MAG TPA: energy transducer TonB [Steroidobacteraceae bacterium]|nr:energy transducer TonB [Steroidobacteraceae bacterium]